MNGITQWLLLDVKKLPTMSVIYLEVCVPPCSAIYPQEIWAEPVQRINVPYHMLPCMSSVSLSFAFSVDLSLLSLQMGFSAE